MPEYKCWREQQPDITILDGQLLPSVDSENLTFLYGLTREGIKLDLSVTSEFANLLGDYTYLRSNYVGGIETSPQTYLNRSILCLSLGEVLKSK